MITPTPAEIRHAVVSMINTPILLQATPSGIAKMRDTHRGNHIDASVHMIYEDGTTFTLCKITCSAFRGLDGQADATPEGQNTRIKIPPIPSVDGELRGGTGFRNLVLAEENVFVIGRKITAVGGTMNTGPHLCDSSHEFEPASIQAGIICLTVDAKEGEWVLKMGWAPGSQ